MASRAAASALLLAICACSTPSAVPVPGDLTVRVATDVRTLLAQLNPVPGTDAERMQRLREMFEEVGCPQVEQRGIDGDELETTSCSLPGESSLTVTVGAAFDEPARKGASDDWPSAAMLPSLYRALQAEPRALSFEFVAFVGAKRKLPGHGTPGGARFYLEQLPKPTRLRTVALVSLNGFGVGSSEPCSFELTAEDRAKCLNNRKRGPIGAWEAAADPNLFLDLRSVASSLDMPIQKLALKKYPAGNLHYLGQLTAPSIYLFVADPLGGSFSGEYLDSYRILAVYLAYLDQTIPRRGE